MRGQIVPQAHVEHDNELRLSRWIQAVIIDAEEFARCSQEAGEFAAAAAIVGEHEELMLVVGQYAPDMAADTQQGIDVEDAQERHPPAAKALGYAEFYCPFKPFCHSLDIGFDEELRRMRHADERRAPTKREQQPTIGQQSAMPAQPAQDELPESGQGGGLDMQNLLAGGGEEVVQRNLAAEEHVVIEVQKMRGQAGDAVQKRLNDTGIERRQMAVIGENRFVIDDLDLRMGGVQPVRHLVVGDDKDAAYPGCVFVQCAQGVFELAIISPAFRRGLPRNPAPPVQSTFGAVLRVRAVDPGINGIHGDHGFGHPLLGLTKPIINTHGTRHNTPLFLGARPG